MFFKNMCSPPPLWSMFYEFLSSNLGYWLSRLGLPVVENTSVAASAARRLISYLVWTHQRSADANARGTGAMAGQEVKASFRHSNSQGFELATSDEQTHHLFPTHKSPRTLCREYNIKIEEDQTSASQLTEKKKGDREYEHTATSEITSGESSESEVQAERPSKVCALLLHHQ
jgi:hypothetical protein